MRYSVYLIRIFMGFKNWKISLNDNLNCGNFEVFVWIINRAFEITYIFIYIILFSIII